MLTSFFWFILCFQLENKVLDQDKLAVSFFKFYANTT